MPNQQSAKHELRNDVTLDLRLPLDDAEALFLFISRAVDVRPTLVPSAVHRIHARLRKALRHFEWTNYPEGTSRLERAFSREGRGVWRASAAIERAGTDLYVV